MADLLSNRPFCSNNLMISSECKKQVISLIVLVYGEIGQGGQGIHKLNKRNFGFLYRI